MVQESDLPLHHTYLIEGTAERARHLLQRLGFEEARRIGDVWEWEGELLSIETAREAGRIASLTPRGNRRFLILAATRFSPQAQQALLKLTEEPPASTIVALVAPSLTLLIPTLRSRAVAIPQHAPLPFAEGTLAHQFLAASLRERLALARSVAQGKGGREALPTLLTSLRALARQHQWGFQTQQALVEAMLWNEVGTANRKAVLEYLAFRLPRIASGKES